jgi:hypothetical protein
VTVLQRVPFWAALPVLAAATIGGVYLASRTHDFVWFILVLAIVAIGAVLYLVDYSRLPQPAPPAPRTPRASSASEPSSPALGGSSTAHEPAAPLPVEPAAPLDPVDLEPDYDPVAEADTLESGAPEPSNAPGDGAPPA